jgi:hypothetical protein
VRTEVEAGASPRLVQQPAGPSSSGGSGAVAGPYEGRSALASGWIPVLLLAIGVVGVWRFYDVRFLTIGAFVAYIVIGVTIPGTLIWRAAHRRPAPLAEDLAAGLAVGYTLEVFVYVAARAVGLPLLVLVFPLATIGIFGAVPRLRGFWSVRGPDVVRVPAVWSWLLTGAAGLVVCLSVKFFRGYGLRWPTYADPDTDSTFHLALVGEAKHHMPMRVPWVSGEPLYYHWFVYAEMASTSWVTGIEPQVLMLRLSMLPMLLAFTVLVAFLGRRYAGHWWTGIAAVVATLFVLAPDPSGWPMYKTFTGLGFSPVDDGSSVRLTTWTGPPQTFGALLFVPLIMVLLDLLGGAGRDRRKWILFVVLICGVSGAKATYLPLLLAGLVTVVAGHLIVRRRLHRAAAGATGITLACVAFAQFVLFGGVSQGLEWAPLTDVRTSPLAATTGFMGDPAAWHAQLILAIAIWSWICVWAGFSGYLRRWRNLGRPEVLLLLGIGAAGLLATSLLGQSGDSQRYFLESARPCLSLAAVGGLAAVLEDRRDRLGAAGRARRPIDLGGRPWWRGGALAGAAVAGALTVWAISANGIQDPPTFYTTPSWWRHDWRLLAHAIAQPYEVTVEVAAAVAVLLLVSRLFVRGIGHAFLVVFLAGYGMATTYANLDGIVGDAAAHGWHTVGGERPLLVTRGTLEAGRWLRDHSDPNDIVATNEHCLPPVTAQLCENLHFSVSAYTERRVLLEGWGFTATAHAIADRTGAWDGGVPYWRPTVQRDNDAAFASPSAGTLTVLKQRYKVRWLFVDESRSRPSFAGLLTPRFRSGLCVVYEL